MFSLAVGLLITSATVFRRAPKVAAPFSPIIVVVLFLRAYRFYVSYDMCY